MDSNKLMEILKKHAERLRGDENGERADLSGADLSGADLSGADLSGADLSGADLSGADLYSSDLSGANLCAANLSRANLNRANLSDANLCVANLNRANLSGANLSEAILCEADLYGANLGRADLSGANLSEANLYKTNLHWAKIEEETKRTLFPLVCPEEGSFIAWKTNGDYIIKLQVEENAKRSSADGRKCRCSKAKVLEIQNVDGTKADKMSVRSSYDLDFIYTIGETVEVDNFDDDRWNECSSGIHFFITRQEAVDWMF